MKRSVCLLWHSHAVAEGESDEKLLRVYSTEERALSRVDQARLLPGFRDVPGGFQVVRYELDKDEWPEGYRTDSGVDVLHWFEGGGGPPTRT
jgi:hypothetical protein